MHCLPEKGRVVPTHEAVWKHDTSIESWRNLLVAVDALVVAVLDVSVVRPALEEAAEVAAKAADAAPIVDLLLAVGTAVRDRSRAQEIEPSNPSPNKTHCSRINAVAIAIDETTIASTAAEPEGPELPPSVLIGFAAVGEELAALDLRRAEHPAARRPRLRQPEQARATPRPHPRLDADAGRGTQHRQRDRRRALVIDLVNGKGIPTPGRCCSPAARSGSRT